MDDVVKRERVKMATVRERLEHVLCRALLDPDKVRRAMGMGEGAYYKKTGWRATWRSDPYDWYMMASQTSFRSVETKCSPVPKDVQEIAKAVHEEFPEGGLEVHWLYKDPFLAVIINGKRYWLAHWNCPFYDKVKGKTMEQIVGAARIVDDIS